MSKQQSHSQSREQLDQALPELYGQLRAIAARAMERERPGHTLQTTALVHEAYLRLCEQQQVAWNSRRQILAAAANAMRRILVDHARRRAARKRSANQVVIDLVEVPAESGPAAVDLLALDQALDRLAERDGRQSRIVELRYFGGLTLDEVALEVGLSLATVKREWVIAKAWLKRELSDEAFGTEMSGSVTKQSV